MTATVEILADSIRPDGTGPRLTTFLIRGFPKVLLAELNTHRALSRNAASSRAVPARIMRARVRRDPWEPIEWTRNCRGMFGRNCLSGVQLSLCLWTWRAARWPAVAAHWLMDRMGLHKQYVNRILEPWLTVDIVLSGTEWRGFLAQRTHEAAQPDFRDVALKIGRRLEVFSPRRTEVHLPMLTPEERELAESKPGSGMYLWARVSAARCARASYYYHDGKRPSVEQDMELFDRLVLRVGDDKTPRHFSPLEHPAFVADLPTDRWGNFVGWKQYRKTMSYCESGGDYQGSQYCMRDTGIPTDAEVEDWVRLATGPLVPADGEPNT